MKKNQIVLESDRNFTQENEFKKELSKLAKQQPNKKLLGIVDFKLGAYNLGIRRDSVRSKKGRERQPRETKSGEQKPPRNWLKNKVGEPPVIFDSSLVQLSDTSMWNYLFNQGYFNAKVQSSYTTKKHKTTVKFVVVPNDQFNIRKVYFSAEDSVVNRIINQPKNLEETLILEGKPYNAKLFDQERSRLSEIVENEGYFTFNKKYVYAEMDSSIAGNNVDAFVKIKNPIDQSNHKKYYMGSVFFDIDPVGIATKELSSIDTTVIRGINIITAKSKLKPDVVARSIFFEPDSIYRKRYYSNTVRRLNDLGVFRSVNVRFEPYQISRDEGVLDTYISTGFTKKQKARIEIEGNTDAKNSLGTSLNLNYLNKNIFKRADRFEMNFSGGFEFQFQKENEAEVRESFVNTITLNADAKFTFPKIMFLPWSKALKKQQANYPSFYNRSSYLRLGYNYERRVLFYTISKADISFGYEWQSSLKSKHKLDLVSLDLVSPRPNSFTESFNATLDQFPTLAQSFSQQFIARFIDYTFQFNSQVFGSDRNHIYFEANGGFAGNILQGIYSLANANSSRTKPYGFFKTPYSQFARFTTDTRYYLNTKRGQTFVVRLNAGLGIPYGNSEVLPYVEQFFGGGNQSLRAWRFRGIGPGGFDASDVEGLSDQTGDIQLEFNTEFRFNIYKFIEGAAFMDVGNVWQIKEREGVPLGNFDFNRFYKEIAMDIGLGVRLDFNFFIVRLDAAIPLRDPSKALDERWRFNSIDFGDKAYRQDEIGFNIAIGYPF